jgi:hypothetical protein
MTFPEPPTIIDASTSSDTTSTSTSNDGSFYNPTSAETLLVRSLLIQLKLPTELALAVIDLADYYPVVRGHEATELDVPASTHRLNSAAVLYAVTNPIPESVNGERIRTRSVSFELRSHDQGWGGDRACRGMVPLQLSNCRAGILCHSCPCCALYLSISMSPYSIYFWYIIKHSSEFISLRIPPRHLLTAPLYSGTYSGSYTWFEACILRPIPCSPPARPLRLPYTFNPHPTAVCLNPLGYTLVPCSASSREETVIWHIQSNVCARSQEMVHRVEWRPGEVQEMRPGRGIGKAFVEKLRPGDRVGVWVRALVSLLCCLSVYAFGNGRGLGSL